MARTDSDPSTIQDTIFTPLKHASHFIKQQREQLIKQQQQEAEVKKSKIVHQTRNRLSGTPVE